MKGFADSTTDGVAYSARPGVKAGNPAIDYLNSWFYSVEQRRDKRARDDLEKRLEKLRETMGYCCGESN